MVSPGRIRNDTSRNTSVPAAEYRNPTERNSASPRNRSGILAGSQPSLGVHLGTGAYHVSYGHERCRT
jgi:hypothetical protein